MKTILMILTNPYRPDVRVKKEIDYLTKVGCKVILLAWDRENEPYDPYYEKGNLEIYRVKVKSKYGSGYRQLFPFFKFSFEINKIVNNISFDIIYCHDLDARIAWTLSFSKKKRRKIVFDMHEIYDLRTERKLLSKIFYLTTLLYTKLSDYVIYVNENQLRFSSSKNVSKFLFIPNYPYKMNISKTSKSNNQIIVSYIGDVRFYDELKYLIDELGNDSRFQVFIHGKGVATEMIREYSLSFENVNVTGIFKYNEIGLLYSKTDYLYSVLPYGNRQSNVLVPTKYYEAMNFKKPMIVRSDSVLADIVTNTKSGIVLKDFEEGTLKDALLRSKSNFHFPSCFDWNDVVIKLESIDLK